MFSTDASCDFEELFDDDMQFDDATMKTPPNKKRKSFEINPIVETKKKISDVKVLNKNDPLGLNVLLKNKSSSSSGLPEGYKKPVREKCLQHESVQNDDGFDEDDNILTCALDSLDSNHLLQNDKVKKLNIVSQSKKCSEIPFKGTTVLPLKGTKEDIEEPSFPLTVKFNNYLDQKMNNPEHCSVKVDKLVDFDSPLCTDSELDFSLEKSPEWKPELTNYNVNIFSKRTDLSGEISLNSKELNGSRKISNIVNNVEINNSCASDDFRSVVFTEGNSSKENAPDMKDSGFHVSLDRNKANINYKVPENITIEEKSLSPERQNILRESMSKTNVNNNESSFGLSKISNQTNSINDLSDSSSLNKLKTKPSGLNFCDRDGQNPVIQNKGKFMEHTSLGNNMNYMINSSHVQNNKDNNSFGLHTPGYQNSTREFVTPVDTVAKSISMNSSDTPVSSKPASSCSSAKRKRKFPGPAGVLPKLKPGMNLNDVNLLKPVSPNITPRKRVVETNEIPSSQSWEDRFQEEPWINMKRELEPKANQLLEEFCITALLKKASKKMLPRGKVPVVCVIIDQLSTHNADASVVLRDPSGEMKGTVHRQLMKDHPTELVVGTVLVLRQCGVFSPSPRSHYLNITPNNVVRIYSKSTENMQTTRLSDFTSDDFVIPVPSVMDVSNSSLAVPNRSVLNQSVNRLPFGVVGTSQGFNIARNQSPTFQQTYSPKVQPVVGRYQSPRFNSNRGSNNATSYRQPFRPDFPYQSKSVLSTPPSNPINSSKNGSYTRNISNLSSSQIYPSKPAVQYSEPYTRYNNISDPKHLNNNKYPVHSAAVNSCATASKPEMRVPQSISSNNFNSRNVPNVVHNTGHQTPLRNLSSLSNASVTTPKNDGKKSFTFKKSPTSGVTNVCQGQVQDKGSIVSDVNCQGIDFSLQDDNLDDLLTGIDEEMFADM